MAWIGGAKRVIRALQQIGQKHTEKWKEKDTADTGQPTLIPGWEDTHHTKK